MHAYAAHPGEHVLHPSAVTTLFPHVSPRQTLRLRWLLLGGALVVFLIGLGRLVPLAIVLGALLLLVFYLAYFYVAEVYKDEPLPMLLATFATGGLLGALMSAGFYRVILGQRRLAFGRSPGYILLTGVALPLLAQALEQLSGWLSRQYIADVGEPSGGIFRSDALKGMTNGLL